MVKQKSCHGSNVKFRVQILVGLLTHGVCGVAVAARLAVNQEARVRLPSDTLFARTNTSVFLGEPPASKTGSRGPNPRARA